MKDIVKDSDRSRFSSRSLSTIGRLTLATVAVGSVIVACRSGGGDEQPQPTATMTDQEKSEAKCQPQKVDFLFQDQSTLTAVQYAQQFDLIYKQNWKRVYSGFFGPDGERISLDEYADVFFDSENKKTIISPYRNVHVTYLEIDSQNDDLTFPHNARADNQYTVRENGRAYRINETSEYRQVDGLPMGQEGSYIETRPGVNAETLTPEEVYHLAKELTRVFNLAVDNNSFYIEKNLGESVIVRRPCETQS